MSAKMFSAERGSLTQNRRNTHIVSKNVFFVYLGHGVIHRDAIGFFAEVTQYEAP